MDRAAAVASSARGVGASARAASPSRPPPPPRDVAVMSGGGGKLRVLALHSWRTSASIFAKQLAVAGWTNDDGTGLGDQCEFVCVDAPHPASGEIPRDVARAFEGPYYEWWDASRDDRDGSLRYVGDDASVAFVERVAREDGPFDGVVGFSQGATFAGLLAAIGAVDGRGPFAAVSAEAPPVFAILLSGMLARTSEAAATYAEAKDSPRHASIPTMHVIGAADRVMPPALSERLASEFADPVIVTHERGHVVPRLERDALATARNFLAARAAAAREARDGSPRSSL
ncbi:uncharacterized protein MICPUCDRAFT_56871 [Micromonas pusilla CCMP1545]|jgi:predicted esterase|uniref:Predicted protein n=1 Tax=Micromonas pusilla (strain CCMP1545) TaxID=564608 RepID=C1MNC9_MICPC|nr:uncharacterized protein MICPUCDRAFT_56871 [Micromonas pusilla CCMP1545]EEH59203.1 predicted protein [Micromonas pusilla CCMP1545]|eukprot:XP_003057558.1 predicted protein [Micromonas pusilla CCMP1545]